MSKINIETPDGIITIEGKCISSKLMWSKNVEDRTHLKNGIYSTKQIPTDYYKEIWQIDYDFEPIWNVNSNNVELLKFVTSAGDRYMLRVNIE
jgi:hypothetical protein